MQLHLPKGNIPVVRAVAYCAPSTLVASVLIVDPTCDVNRCEALLNLQEEAELCRFERRVKRCCLAQCKAENHCTFNWIIAFINNSNLPFCHKRENSSMQLAKHIPCNYNISGLNVASSLILSSSIQICFIGPHNYLSTVMPKQIKLLHSMLFLNLIFCLFSMFRLLFSLPYIV